ncbi:hypothetical protein U1Q18_004857 [Sarracenia purpurea var. burkii]
MEMDRERERRELQQQQWQKEEEEEEEVEETEEHVVEAEALQGRRPRHPTTTAAAIDANDSISNGEVMLLSEPANEFQEQEYRQEELQNGSEISNEVEVESQERAEKNVYYDQDEGTESIYGFSITENGDIQDSAFEKNPGEDGLIVALKNFDSQQSQNTVVNQYKENLKDNNLSSCRLLPLDKSSEECRANKSFSDITDAHDEIELIKEIDQEFTELDVERVLEKQDTHDLYCPNCNSCITRRVILCKRKRKIRISGEDAKRNKLETGVASESHAISDHVTNNQGCSAADILLDANLTPAADDYNRGREPEIFKCLSCFSFFIPTGDGFKLFKIFGNKSENENMQHPQPISVSKKNWFSSIFASHKEEISIEQGIGSKAGVEENIVGVSKQEVTSPQPFVARELVKKSTAEHQEEAVDIHWNAPLKADKDATSQLIQDALLIQDGQINITQDLKDLPAKSSTGIGLEAGDREGGEDFEPSSTQGSKLHTEEPTENVIYKPQQDELKILVHSSTESITIEKSQIDHKPNVEIERKSADDKDSVMLLPKPVSVLGESDISDKVNIEAGFPFKAKNIKVKISGNETMQAANRITFPEAVYSSGVYQNAIIGTKMDIHMNQPLKADKDAFSLSVQDTLLIQDRQINITKDLKDMPAKHSAGNDTIIIIKERPVEPAASQETQDIITLPEMGSTAHTESAEATELKGLEIIKSLVYGGLIESLTSLGIVSSAAGADTATLNILALGLANLIGGLFIIGHNLWELKNDHSGGASNQVTGDVIEQATTQLDRYQELLGRRVNFLLHAIVAIISYLIFGLLPPIVYGFSFRESDNRDFKLIAVAASSLLSIIILASGKAYIQRPPKAYIKTVLHYVIIGFMASGFSYAVGDLIKKLLEKLGWFSSSLVLTLPPLETSPVQPWTSY